MNQQFENNGVNPVLDNQVDNQVAKFLKEEEGMKKKFFSFSGRIGRETFARRGLVSSAIFAIYFMFIFLIGVVSLSGFDQGGVIFPLVIFFAPGVIIYVWSLLSLGVRRFHDQGHSGQSFAGLLGLGALLLGIQFFLMRNWFGTGGEDIGTLQMISMLLQIPTSLFGFYLTLWPGTRATNCYGEPPRSHRFSDQTAWEQFKQEYCSFSGRVGRKYFFGILTFGASQVLEFSIGLFAAPLMLKIFTMISKTSGSLYAEILSFFLGGVGFVATGLGMMMMLSLIVRRFQDIGIPRWGAILVFSGYLYSLIKPIVMIYEMGPRAVFILNQNMGYYLLVPLSLLVISVIPGKKGVNQHGPNPVEVGLLPGEKEESMDEKLLFNKSLEARENGKPME